MFTIDIDTGGTCTDGFISQEGETKSVKVLTTPHDLTICLAECVEEGARAYNVTLQEMLANTEVIRYSTTTGVNALITRSGSKIGLIVSKGYKANLYAESEEEAKPVFSLVAEEMTTEIDEVINETGDITLALKKTEVLDAMQYLIDMGARAIVVSLKNSHLNPLHEKRCKAIIKDQYPNFYLGSVRVFLSSEISDRPGDFARTNTVVANGYIHDILVKYLYKAEDDLRNNFCRHPLMVAHSHGGVARVAKTRAIDTYSSGPALGVIGAANLGKAYGIKDIITVDIGGTSLDIGIIQNGLHHYDSSPEIIGFPISVPMITTYSAPIASGSIAWINKQKELKVGPKSAGAKPGPICFDLGGMEPTVTDADVVLGYIDPDYFLGGRIKLNKAKAEKFINLKIAKRLGVSEGKAAWMIRKEMANTTVQEIRQFVESKNIRSELSDFTMVVYGGAGPTHYADFIQELGFGNSIATPFAAVFSAFGASTTDILHSYTRTISSSQQDGKPLSPDYEYLYEIINNLLETAKKDIRGEGFHPDRADYSLELKNSDASDENKMIVDGMDINSAKELKRICESHSIGVNLFMVTEVKLDATVPMPHIEMKSYDMKGTAPEKALKKTRPVYWSPETEYQDTPIYSLELLNPGNVVKGPAVVESKDTTYVVPEGLILQIDKYQNIVMKGE